jgi:hypothetical protein
MKMNWITLLPILFCPPEYTVERHFNPPDMVVNALLPSGFVARDSERQTFRVSTNSESDQVIEGTQLSTRLENGIAVFKSKNGHLVVSNGPRTVRVQFPTYENFSVTSDWHGLYVEPGDGKETKIYKQNLLEPSSKAELVAKVRPGATRFLYGSTSNNFGIVIQYDETAVLYVYQNGSGRYVKMYQNQTIFLPMAIFPSGDIGGSLAQSNRDDPNFATFDTDLVSGRRGSVGSPWYIPTDPCILKNGSNYAEVIYSINGQEDAYNFSPVLMQLPNGYLVKHGSEYPESLWIVTKEDAKMIWTNADRDAQNECSLRAFDCVNNRILITFRNRFEIWSFNK